jgi:uncharacterized phage-associated protein
MQKLLYYAQAWYLVNFKLPLFGEAIKAWNLGPVIKEIYDAFKKYGASPIKYEVTSREPEVFTNEQINYLDEFYDVFIKLSAHELVNMSHNELPWREALKTAHKTISLDSMERYYNSLVK